MTISFFAEQVEQPLGFAIGCHCPDAQRQAPLHATYEEAEKAYLAIPGAKGTDHQNPRTALPGCTEEMCLTFALYIRPVEADPSPKRAFAINKARLLLSTLGLDPDEYCGVDEAETFVGRVQIALGLSPHDKGVPAHRSAKHNEDTEPGTIVMIECGRAPGYLQDSLAELHEIGQWCLQRGRRVTWA